MTWTKLLDDFADDCARVELSDRAFRTHVEALLWSMRRENGGLMTTLDLKRGCEAADATTVKELVDVGFWQLIPDVGWQIVHHLEHQPEPDVLAKRRSATAVRTREYRRRKAGMGDEDDVRAGTSAQDRDASRDTSCDAVTPRVTRDGSGRDGTGTSSTTSFPHRGSQDPSRERRSKLRSDARDVPTGEIRNIVDKGSRVQDRACRLVADILGKTTDDVRQVLEYGDDEWGDKLAGLIEETLVPALVGGLSDKDVKTELRRARDADHDITWATFDQPAQNWRDGA